MGCDKYFLRAAPYVFVSAVLIYLSSTIFASFSKGDYVLPKYRGWCGKEVVILLDCSRTDLDVVRFASEIEIIDLLKSRVSKLTYAPSERLQGINSAFLSKNYAINSRQGDSIKRKILQIGCVPYSEGKGSSQVLHVRGEPDFYVSIISMDTVALFGYSPSLGKVLVPCTREFLGGIEEVYVVKKLLPVLSGAAAL